MLLCMRYPLTSRKRNTHITESREVLYRWHPWFGRMAWIFNVVEKNGQAVVRCALDPLETARVSEVIAVDVRSRFLLSHHIATATNRKLRDAARTEAPVGR
jgi:hypothetical protein